MIDQLLTIGETVQMARISRAHIYKLIEQGLFPRPVKIGPKTARWRATEVVAWMDSLQK